MPAGYSGVVLVALALFGCSGEVATDAAGREAIMEHLQAVRDKGVRRRADPRPDVVLISLDTVRADALSSYGGILPFSGAGADPGTVTPTLDDLAAKGVRFDFALSQAPTTLPSHSAVFTGLDSHGHGVVRNGFRLGGEETTLAERFSGAGYDTIGVIGASVLDAKTGISRGFSTWDETLAHPHGNNRHEATATEVTDRALDILKSHDAGQPLLLFVHYYDAHAPYDAPGPFTRRFGDAPYHGFFDGSRRTMKEAVQISRETGLDPADVAEVRARYLGEVAYIDSELRRLLMGVGATLARGVPRVVAAFGDHGEVLGEEAMNPLGHGASVDVWALRVPLIISGAGVPEGVVVARQARLMDVGSTLLTLAGLKGSLGNGVDLGAGWEVGQPGAARQPVEAGASPADPQVPAVVPADPQVPARAPPSPIAFAEASQPDDHAAETGWPNLPFMRAAYRDGYACQRFPLSYPGVRTFAVSGDSQVPTSAPAARDLCDALAAWDTKLPATAGENVDADTKEGLKALGYQE